LRFRAYEAGTARSAERPDRNRARIRRGDELIVAGLHAPSECNPPPGTTDTSWPASAVVIADPVSYEMVE